MKKILFIISMMTCTILYGQNDSWEKLRSKSDSICESELHLKFDQTVGKYGYVDAEGIFILEPQFYCATEFIDCMALTSKKKQCIAKANGEKEKWFYINKANEFVIPPRVENRAKWKKEIKTAPNKTYKQ